MIFRRLNQGFNRRKIILTPFFLRKIILTPFFLFCGID